MATASGAFALEGIGPRGTGERRHPRRRPFQSRQVQATQVERTQVEPRRGLRLRLEIRPQRPAAPEKERDILLNRAATNMAKNF